eukprot:g57071.t1
MSDDQEQPTKKAKISQKDFNDHAISDEEWDMSRKVAKLERDVQNVNDRFQREISQLFGKVMETEIPKIMDKAVVHSVSEASSQEVIDKYLSSLATKLQTVVGPVFEDISKRQHQEKIEAQRELLRKEDSTLKTFLTTLSSRGLEESRYHEQRVPSGG